MQIRTITYIYSMYIFKRIYIIFILLHFLSSANAQLIQPKKLVRQIKKGDLINFQKSIQIDSTLLNYRFKDSSNLLIVALNNNKTEIAKFLIEKGIEINIETKKHITPLLISTRLRQYEITKLLVKSGASINVEANYGETPLRNSMQLFKPDSNIDFEIFKFLISNGADFKHICERCGSTSYLIAAISSYKNAMAIYLLDIGIDNIEHKTRRGFNSLHFAIAQNNLEIVKHLIEKGADINEKTTKGLTVFQIASLSESYEVLDFLESNYNEENKK